MNFPTSQGRLMQTYEQTLHTVLYGSCNSKAAHSALEATINDIHMYTAFHDSPGEQQHDVLWHQIAM